MDIGVEMEDIARNTPGTGREHGEVTHRKLPIWLFTRCELRASRRIREVLWMLAQGLARVWEQSGMGLWSFLTLLRCLSHIDPPPMHALQGSVTGMQRLLSVSAAKPTHADWQEAAVGFNDPRWPEWRLYEVLRP
ncbi:hypothetical protein [Hydrogenophaga crassostreae]|nr:hypothetical protein [Hydrogenophaga crassostreae]AOW13742.1 hypothetical protein LPB072_13705 [Hydrogenophaga crassostreae]